MYGQLVARAAELERRPGGLAAEILIGNPFTDVTELGTTVLVCLDDRPEEARDAALELARDFWDQRTAMQASLSVCRDAGRGADRL